MSNPLQKQLNHQKFLTTIDYVRKAASGPKVLMTHELAQINLMMLGRDTHSDFEPWRMEAMNVRIPSGKDLQFNVVSNPINRARDVIGHALHLANNGDGLEGAFFLYSQLVLSHLFKEANRRTAVAGSLWILLIAGLDCDASSLLELPIGDLREPQSLADLRAAMKAIV